MWSKVIRFNPETNIYTAEIFAIYTAVSWINEQNIVDATIYTDSMSSLQTLGNPIPTNKYAEKIKSIIGPRVKLMWINSHTGEYGDELADKLAKEGAEKDLIDIELAPETSYYKAILRRISLEEWQRRWDYADKGRHTY